MIRGLTNRSQWNLLKFDISRRLGATMANPPRLMKLMQPVFADFGIGLERSRTWRPSARGLLLLMASLSSCHVSVSQETCVQLRVATEQRQLCGSSWLSCGEFIMSCIFLA